MRQIPVGFDKKTEELLRKNAKEKAITLAQYIRSLVDIGLRVEVMAEQTSGKKQANDGVIEELRLQQKLLQKGLLASYESLYLIRYLLVHLPEEKAGEHHQLLDNAQLKAKSLIEGLIG